MGVADTGSTEASWQALQVVSSATLATPPGRLSLRDEPHPPSSAARESTINITILNFMLRIVSPPEFLPSGVAVAFRSHSNYEWGRQKYRHQPVRPVNTMTVTFAHLAAFRSMVGHNISRLEQNQWATAYFNSVDHDDFKIALRCRNSLIGSGTGRTEKNRIRRFRQLRRTSALYTALGVAASGNYLLPRSVFAILQSQF